MNKNTIVWCDIPVKDLERASSFYGKVLDVKTNRMEGFPVVVLEHEEGTVSGCLVQSDENTPSTNGPLIYFNINGRHEEADALVEENGGVLVKPKHEIGPYGFRSVFKDSEGNRVALHSV